MDTFKITKSIKRMVGHLSQTPPADTISFHLLILNKMTLKDFPEFKGDNMPI